MILIPFFSSYHAPFVQYALDQAEVDCLVVDELEKHVIARGMKSTNNDACYVSILSVGQALSAVSGLRESIQKDLNVVVPRICLHCRSNDVPLQVEEAFKAEKIAFGYVRDALKAIASLLSASLSKIAEAVALGDAFLQVELALRPYVSGDKLLELEKLLSSWRDEACFWLEDSEGVPFASLLRAFDDDARSFASSSRRRLPLIGVIGSAGAVFNRGINNDLVQSIERENCEVALPYLAPLAARAFAAGEEGSCCLSRHLAECCEIMASTMSCVRFSCPSVSDLELRGTEVVPRWVDSGMGWTLAGQALLFAEGGAVGIVYARTFGCLAGHVCGQGVLKRLREIGDSHGSSVAYATIEYDPGTSALNQMNRIKLLATIAKENVYR